MRSFQVIGEYFSAAKNKVTSAVQSMWQKDSIQTAYQGLTAPVSSSQSFQKLVSSSKDIQTCLSRAVVENVTFATQAIISYFLYYRVVHPVLQESENSVVYSIDLSFYIAMIGYLISQGLQNSAHNLLLTAAITDTAAKTMTPSADLKPSDQKAESMTGMGRDDVIYYLANRYVVNPVSWKISHGIPGFCGKALAFGLETLSIGLPLVKYKFRVSGQGNFQQYNELLSHYKTYCIMYGASFVAATWSAYNIAEKLSGEENPYVFDAVFSSMFQLYALLAMAREEKLPAREEKPQSMLPLDEKVAVQPPERRSLTLFDRLPENVLENKESIIPANPPILATRSPR